MKDLRIPLVVVLGLALVFPLSFTTVTAASLDPTQAQSTALERGYRTGYSDGYNAGYRDVADGASRDFQNKQEYQRADRSFNPVWGPPEDYRDGYQQGFENGYAAGYDRQPFNSSIPTGFGRRGSPDEVVAQTTPQSTPQSAGQPANPDVVSAGPVMIPRDMIFTVELLTPISTDVSQRGDPFQARVIQPAQYAGAIVEGRITNVKRAGKAKGRAELQLSFERIRMPDNRIANFRADLVEVVQMGSSDGVGDVDPEGGVKGRSSTKDDVSKVGAATGIGAIIGAIAGGGKGAAIGAVIGGAVGTGGVLSQRGKDIRLSQGQQLRIRTATETQL
ncbi:MAG TPA: hypothetical protein VE135_01525 [Pyrinomonadaceae bacterium]|nr:hypothetical protein [Pyrinomonadaceae bacterium]